MDTEIRQLRIVGDTFDKIMTCPRDAYSMPLCSTAVEDWEAWTSLPVGEVVELVDEDGSKMKVKVGLFEMSCFHPHHQEVIKIR